MKGVHSGQERGPGCPMASSHAESLIEGSQRGYRGSEGAETIFSHCLTVMIPIKAVGGSLSEVMTIEPFNFFFTTPPPCTPHTMQEVFFVDG